MATRTRPPGRRPGTQSTRTDVLLAAREAFATTGFESTSVRAIAERAGVDPSTVLHFFASKDGLFKAVIGEVAPAAQPLLDAQRRSAPGRELVECYLGIWEGERSGPAIRALLRASVASGRATELLREALLEDVLTARPTSDRLGRELALTHLVGVAIGRYIARFPELATASITAVAARVGPVLDVYFGPDDGAPDP